MRVHSSLMLIGLLLFVLPSSAQQAADECKAKIAYENRNQIQYRPLSITAVSGIALDKDRVRIPNVCPGLFTERGHRLVETAVTDQKGDSSLYG